MCKRFMNNGIVIPKYMAVKNTEASTVCIHIPFFASMENLIFLLYIKLLPYIYTILFRTNITGILLQQRHSLWAKESPTLYLQISDVN